MAKLTKTATIAAIAEAADISKAQAKATLEALANLAYNNAADGFTIPGLGRLIAETVQTRDFPVVQSMLMLLASLYVFINLCVDLAYVFFDPRVRL